MSNTAKGTGATAERTEEPDGRDRRGGRRSRRRRNRGRGFPEAKYAQELESRHAPAPPPPPEEVFVPAAGVEEFAVLPGESLAKYQQEEDLPEGAVPDSDAVVVELDADQAPDAPVEEPTGASQIPDLPTLEPVEVGQVHDLPSSQPVPAEPQTEEAEATEPETAAAPPAESDTSWISEADLEAPESNSAAEPAAVPATEAETAEEAEVAEAEALVEAMSSEAQQEPVLDEGVEPARMPVSLTATLREQGQPRYMHRVSRRMRRKMRGGFTEPAAEPRPVDRPVEAPPEPRVEQRPVSRPEKPPLPSIASLLKEGQEILVQIAKEPLGQKGARITSHIALPGRFVVYMPTVEHLGVSRKIESDEERLRLKRILLGHRAGMTGGFIVRTAGEGQSEADIAADMMFLYNLWLDIRQKAEKRPAPALVHHDLDLVHRLLRDQVSENFKAVWCDNEEVYESVARFVERFQPALVGRVRMYTRSAPIFDAFNVTSELEKALRPKVWLKSGGYIVINQTEALVAIDINTGKFVGKSNRLEDTIVKTNTEAIREIVRQIRLRDLGGIIVIDFIDMDERKSRQKVMQTLEETMRSDRAPYKILQFNDFGLVAITRKRVKQSLERTLCSTCPYCEGAGYVKSVQTVVSEILQEAHKIARAVEGREVLLRVNPEVAKLLKSNDNDYLEEIEEVLGRPVLIKSDPAIHQEKFDLV